MRFVSLLVASLTLSGGMVSRTEAAGPDDSYIEAYRAMDEADQSAKSGDSKSARAKYQEAGEMLKKIQTTYPSWNSRTIQYRLDYIEQKLKVFPDAKAQAEVKPAKEGQGAAKAPDVKEQIAALQEQLAKLQGDNGMLEAKLKEALTAQPAAIDPRELSKAEDHVKQVEKEKELLKANLEQAQAKQPQAAELALLEQNKNELADTKKKLVDTVAEVATLSQEKVALQAANEKLQQALTSSAKAPVPAPLPTAAPVTAAVSTISPGATVAELREQVANDQKALGIQNKFISDLKTQLAETKLETERIKHPDPSEAEKKVAALEKERDNLVRQKMDLESQLVTRVAIAGGTGAQASASSAGDSTRVRQLEQERSDLLAKLSDANKELYESKTKAGGDQTDFLKRQIGTLQARVDVLEARKTPYTAEELALFKTSAPLANVEEPKPAKKEIRELPKEAAPLMREAQRAFADKKYAEAEAKYQQVLALDPDHPITLGNLGAIQIERGKLDDAEKTLKKGLNTAPEDAYLLMNLGKVYFDQRKYDDALDALSKSAQIDSKNPETQNLLGITLSQQGHREAAEAALRKAIQLAPNYAGAHKNLAVVYATQKPPFVELAKYHYQKAMANGEQASPEFEKTLKEAEQASGK